MEQLTIDTHASAARNQTKESSWLDEAGISVPATRISKLEKVKERGAFKVYNDALKINADLMAFKKYLSDLCQQVYTETMSQLKVDGKKGQGKGKGGFTWFNFDRSIKIQVAINENIAFDDLTIQAAKAKMDVYLEGELNDKDKFLREVITDAFTTTKGTLDSKNILNLLRYRSKIKAVAFQDALDLIEKSIRKPDKSQYTRVWFRDASGEYNLVNLNFSSI